MYFWKKGLTVTVILKYTLNIVYDLIYPSKNVLDINCPLRIQLWVMLLNLKYFIINKTRLVYVWWG
jgi:hypothetical protein